ncbi:EAL domain-containing protein [Shewanella litorisediminis]|uniref:PTS sugar transporter subunit IIC/EAL domain-containing protein n=1 Tax=Shewanella litorisediminis TaxID=1173586 RepID=A0ABX7G170_9GAMM|nr:EAL domain-containing protein [Shewanella litorisediminis]MCL2918955.1 EAL domain-containing protein [Shewanella litorisediminis]QRH01023.1 PTS sugar transporter subunit IIC/EAL domain-containing protein [Shewanella litorisediminis]
MQVNFQLFDRSFLLAVRESFIALLPFLLINALLALFPVLATALAPELSGSDAFHWFEGISDTLGRLFPLLAMLSLSYHFAKYLDISAVACATLSLCIVFSLHVHSSGGLVFSDYLVEVLGDPRMVITPILAAYVMRPFLKFPQLHLVRSAEISAYLSQHLNLIIPMVLTFTLVFLILKAMSMLLLLGISPMVDAVGELGPLGQIIFRVLLTHILWCFGVHGDNAFLLLIGDDNGLQFLAPNLTFSAFMDLFVLLGGSGATIPLLIAIFLESRDEQSRHLAKIAVPFSVVNINEILIYGLPVVFNLRLAIPFVLLPCLNVLIAWSVISAGLLSFDGKPFPWVTPLFLNGWIASGGFAVVVLQLLLVVVGVFIYRPFIRKYSAFADANQYDRELIKRTELQTDIERMSERQYSRNQSESLAASRSLERTVREVLSGELLVHYQPKLKLPGQEVVGFEALLRLKDADGNIKGPWFIDNFQRAGYSHVIDRFVITTVAEDLRRWQAAGFSPKVSINLDPNNLNDVLMLDRLRTTLGEFAHQVEVEILERAFMRDLQGINRAIAQLQTLGFRFLLDDFGTGFSSLSLLTQISVDGIKLDRSILGKTDTDQGRVLYRQICQLCKSLGFQLVAEGVETPSEASFVGDAGVDYVQGWLYARALPQAQAMEYALNHGKITPNDLDTI